MFLSLVLTKAQVRNTGHLLPATVYNSMGSSWFKFKKITKNNWGAKCRHVPILQSNSSVSESVPAVLMCPFLGRRALDPTFVVYFSPLFINASTLPILVLTSVLNISQTLPLFVCKPLVEFTRENLGHLETTLHRRVGRTSGSNTRSNITVTN